MLRDADLLQDFIATASEEAFASLVERHYAMVVATCRRKTGHAQDAEDAAQAVFLILATKAKRLRGCDSLAGWLHGVACRVASRMRTSVAARRRREQAVALLAQPTEAAPIQLDEELDALSDRYRLPLIMHYLEGLSCEAIAAQLAIRPDNVALRLSRGRQKLREQFERVGSSGACAAWLSTTHAHTVAVPATLPAAASAIGLDRWANAAQLLPSATALWQASLRALLVAQVKLTAMVLAVASLVVGLSAIAVQAVSAEAEDAKPLASASAPAAESLRRDLMDDGMLERTEPVYMADLMTQLERPADVVAKLEPLRQVLHDVERQTGVPIHLGSSILDTDQPGPGWNPPLTMTMKHAHARWILDWIAAISSSYMICRDHGLWWERTPDVHGDLPHWQLLLRPLLHPEAPGQPWSDADRSEAERLLALWQQPVWSACHDATVEGMHLEGDRLVMERASTVEPLDESLLYDLRDRGRHSRPGAAEFAWREHSHHRFDAKVAGPLSDCVDRLRVIGGMPIVITPLDAVAATRNLHLDAHGVTEGEALRQLCAPLGLVVEVCSGPFKSEDPYAGPVPSVFFLSSQRPADFYRVQRIYDLRAVDLEQDGGALSARLSVTALGAQAACVNGLLLVQWDYVHLEALETLLSVLSRLPAEQRAACISAFAPSDEDSVATPPITSGHQGF